MARIPGNDLEDTLLTRVNDLLRTDLHSSGTAGVHSHTDWSGIYPPFHPKENYTSVQITFIWSMLWLHWYNKTILV